jgi:hypothetical protein
MSNLFQVKKILSVISLALTFAFSQMAVAKEKECCWIDVKTGKQVPTVPASGANYYRLDDPADAGQAGVALLSGDRKTARDSRPGKNYALEPCLPRAPRSNQHQAPPTKSPMF